MALSTLRNGKVATATRTATTQARKGYFLNFISEKLFNQREIKDDNGDNVVLTNVSVQMGQDLIKDEKAAFDADGKIWASVTLNRSAKIFPATYKGGIRADGFYNVALGSKGNFMLSISYPTVDIDPSKTDKNGNPAHVYAKSQISVQGLCSYVAAQKAAYNEARTATAAEETTTVEETVEAPAPKAKKRSAK